MDSKSSVGRVNNGVRDYYGAPDMVTGPRPQQPDEGFVHDAGEWVEKRVPPALHPGERTFWGLMIIFAIVAILAITGVFLQAFLGTSSDLIKEAMRIIGYGGPAGSAANTAADAIGLRRKV